LFVFRATAGILQSTPIRVWAAVLPLILPVVAFETMNNISNLQFFLLYAAVWAVLARPLTAVDRWAGVAVVLAATLATPLSLLLAPVIAVRLAATHVWRDHFVTVAWLVGVVVQTAVIASAGGSSYARPAPANWLPDLYALRVLLSAALGIKIADGAWALLGQGAAILASLAAIGFTAYVVTRPTRRSRGSVGLLLVLSVAFFAFGVGLRWSPELIPSPLSLGLADARLTVVPILLVLAAIAIVLDSPDPRWKGPMWRSIVMVTIGSSLLVSGIDYFSVGNRREAGPDWMAEVESARDRCASLGSSITVIPTAPPGWFAELPCERLLAGR
jgi:hypothetical protein